MNKTFEEWNKEWGGPAPAIIENLMLSDWSEERNQLIIKRDYYKTYAEGLLAELDDAKAVYATHATEAEKQIDELQVTNKKLVKALEDCAERMERARQVLKDRSKRDGDPNANWGMLDTQQARAVLKETR